MQLLEPLHHARRLELEHALRITVRINLVRLRVVDRNFLYVNVYSESLLYLREANLDDGQCPESQEVHLEHTHILDERALILGNPHFLVRSLVHAQGDRDIIREVSTSDNHCAGMDTYLADATFKLERVCEYFLDQRRTVFQLVFQFRKIFYTVFQRRFLVDFLLDDLEPLSIPFYDSFSVLRFLSLLQFHLRSLRYGNRLVRNHLGKPVRLIQRQPADTRHVLDGTLRRHCAESDDMRHMVHAVMVLYILDYAITSVIVEVHVDIRH